MVLRHPKLKTFLNSPVGNVIGRRVAAGPTDAEGEIIGDGLVVLLADVAVPLEFRAAINLLVEDRGHERRCGAVMLREISEGLFDGRGVHTVVSTKEFALVLSEKPLAMMPRGFSRRREYG